MNEESFRKLRRKLSYSDTPVSQRISPSQSYSNTHPTNYLELAIDNLNHLINESEQQILIEEQLKTNEDSNILSKIQNLQSEINQNQNTINSLNNKIEKLSVDTYEMLAKLNEAALIRHNRLIIDSIEHIKHILHKDFITNDPYILQLKKELINQQEKLYSIRSQLDIDHNKLITNIDLLNKYQQKRNKLEQIKSKQQTDLQNIQQNESKYYFYLLSNFILFHIVDYLQKQLKLQKLQLSIEQQRRVRDEVQQLERYIEPKKYHRQDKLSEISEIKQDADLTRDRVREIDQKIVDTSEKLLKQQDHTKNHSFVRSKEYRKENDDV